MNLEGLKDDLKKEVIDYYDCLISDVGVKAQTLALNESQEIKKKEIFEENFYVI